jgi:hypothetical protein
MVTHGVGAAIVIGGVLPHFNLLVTVDRLMYEVIETVPRGPPAARNRRGDSEPSVVELLVVLLAGDLPPVLSVHRRPDEP